MSKISVARIRSQAFLSKHSAVINEGHNAFLYGVKDAVAFNPYPKGDERAVAFYIGWKGAYDHYEKMTQFDNIPAELLSAEQPQLEAAA